MRLNELEPGDVAVITGVESVDGGVPKALVMGIVEGSTVRCVSKLYESMEIDVHGTRFAISNHTAKKFNCEKRADVSLVD